MADSKISDLNSASSLTGTELLEVVQGGLNKRSSIAAVVAKVNATRVPKEIPLGAIDGINTVFTLTHSPLSGTEHVYYNGALQEADGQDYTISGSLISFNVPPEVGTKLRVTYNY
jgi:hypothetical protein